MPRPMLLLAPALLAGCSTVAPPAGGEPVPQAAAPAPSASVCRPGDYSRFAGRTRSEATAAELQQASGAALIRWVPPGTMVTMDYREDRMTVKLDSQNRVLSASCG